MSDVAAWATVDVLPSDPTVAERLASFRAALPAELESCGGTLTTDAVHADRERPFAVIGCGDGDRAVRIAASLAGPTSLVLVGASLDQESIDLIASSDDLAVLTLVDPADRAVLAGAIDGHLASPNEVSDVEVGTIDARSAAAVARWLADRARTAVIVEHVTIPTSDGWLLGADLYVGAGDDGADRPAVVLMHTGRSDREVFERLAHLLAARRVAALALDWRGRGASTNLGRFVDFTREQQDAVRNDVTAAYDFLEARDGIDGRRLAVLGIAHGAGYGADGALGDGRTKAVALMTAFHLLDDRQREVLESGDVAVLCVACRPNSKSSAALREIHAVATHRRSRLLEFDEGVLGYQLFDLHADLEPTIADWFAEVLRT